MDASDWTFLGMYIATWLTFLFYIFLTLRCWRLEKKRQRLQDEVEQLEACKVPESKLEKGIRVLANQYLEKGYELRRGFLGLWTLCKPGTNPTDKCLFHSHVVYLVASLADEDQTS